MAVSKDKMPEDFTEWKSGEQHFTYKKTQPNAKNTCNEK